MGPEFYSCPLIVGIRQGCGGRKELATANGFGERSLDHLTFEGDKHQLFRIIACESWTGEEL